MMITKMVQDELKVFKLAAQKKLVDHRLQDLKRSGKPFFWVDHDRLRKLKSLCEQYKDGAVK